MDNVLLNHPHVDSYDGSIVVPIRVGEEHSLTFVYYKTQGEDIEKIMLLKYWLQDCKPVAFNTEEGA